MIAAFGSGDNTYSNYQEAQRAFWRGTVLPLVARMTKAFSGWLAPAYGSGIVLKPVDNLIRDLTRQTGRKNSFVIYEFRQVLERRGPFIDLPAE